MGYPKDLDEYTQGDLLRELERRHTANSEGKCDYCGRKKGVEPFCVQHDRHRQTCACEYEYNGGMTGPPANLVHTKGCPWVPKKSRKKTAKSSSR